MAQDILSQDQIDNLMKDISMGEFENTAIDDLLTPLNPEDVKFKYNTIKTAKLRLDYSYYHNTHEETKDAANNLHYAGFDNWLLKKGITRQEYYILMNKEAIKRGMRPPFKITSY